MDDIGDLMRKGYIQQKMHEGHSHAEAVKLWERLNSKRSQAKNTNAGERRPPSSPGAPPAAPQQAGLLD